MTTTHGQQPNAKDGPPDQKSSRVAQIQQSVNSMQPAHPPRMGRMAIIGWSSFSDSLGELPLSRLCSPLDCTSSSGPSFAVMSSCLWLYLTLSAINVINFFGSDTSVILLQNPNSLCTVFNFEQTELTIYLTVAHIRREKSRGGEAVGPCLKFYWPMTMMLSVTCCR
jgi:hypothetical protein